MQATRKAAPLLGKRRLMMLGLATLAALGLACALPAQADGYTFTYSGAGLSGSGVLTATPEAGYYLVTAGSGADAAFGAFTLVPNPTPGSVSNYDGNGTYDNEIFPSGPTLLDYYGLLFTFNGAGPQDSGGSYLNIYFNGSYMAGQYQGADTGELGPVTFTLTPAATPAPEPSSVAAFAFTGLGAAGLILRARKRRAVA